MYSWDKTVCLHGGYQKLFWKFTKLILAGDLLFLRTFTGGTNGLPEPVVMLWDLGSPLYSKWAIMKWAHPSSFTATQCKVKGCCFFILCCRSHQNFIQTL